MLDAQIDPLQKLKLAPALLDDVDVDSPRAGLTPQRSRPSAAEFADDAAVYDRLAGRLDDVVVVAVQDAFRTAYLIAAALALLAAALLVSAYRRPAGVRSRPRSRPPPFLVYAVEHDREAPAAGRARRTRARSATCPTPAASPARSRTRRCGCSTRRACQVGTSREEFALALFDPAAREAVRARPRRRPAQRGGLLSLLGG